MCSTRSNLIKSLWKTLFMQVEQPICKHVMQNHYNIITVYDMNHVKCLEKSKKEVDVKHKEKTNVGCQVYSGIYNNTV